MAVVLDVGLGPVLAGRYFIVPFALRILVADELGFARDLLLRRDRVGGTLGRVPGLERLGIDAIQPIGTTASLEVGSWTSLNPGAP